MALVGFIGLAAVSCGAFCAGRSDAVEIDRADDTSSRSARWCNRRSGIRFLW